MFHTSWWSRLKTRIFPSHRKVNIFCWKHHNILLNNNTAYKAYISENDNVYYIIKARHDPLGEDKISLKFGNNKVFEINIIKINHKVKASPIVVKKLNSKTK